MFDDSNISQLVQCRGCPSTREACVTRQCKSSEIAIVLDHPTEAEANADLWFKGKRSGAGALLKASIESMGVNLNDIYICSALNCRPAANKKAMQKKAMLACKRRLVTELKAAGVKKVLCVGAIGYSALLSQTKLLAITNVRGCWREAYGMQVMATLPPGFVIGQTDYFRDFARDIEKFFTTEGREPHPDVELWIPDTLTEMTEAMEFVAQAPYVGVDLETYGFSPVDDDVLAAGLAVLDDDKRSATCVILDEAILGKKKTWRLLSEMLSSDQATVFHNGKFDLQFFKEQLVRRNLKYNPNEIHDTMLLNYLLDERPIGRFKAHGLEAIARVRYDAPDYGIHMGKWLEEWRAASDLDKREMREQMHVYLGLDCYYTARAFPDLWNEAMSEEKDDRAEWTLLDLYEKLLMPGSLALAEIEHRGIALDLDMYEDSRVKLERKAKRLLKKLQKTTGKPDFNPGSPTQVKEYIYEDLELPFGLSEDKDGKVYHTARRGGLQEGPTAAPVLKSLAYRFPEHKKVIDDICEYRNYTKNIGTYVVGLLSRVDGDGRLRTTFNLNGTATGRLSSSGPNLQNIPDASHTGVEIRGGFVANPGNVFIEADYKQLEVRIAAWLANDDAMKAVFESGRDPHQEIAFSIYRKPKEEITHYMRWLAKNILFGLLYGRGAESVATGPEQEDIAARGGQRWGIEDVKKFFASLLAEWKDFAQWQKDQAKLGYKEGEIIMPTGRRKRFPFIPRHDGGYVGRASFNNPIQGTASDFTLWALIQLHAQLPKGAWIVLTVHDSIMIECEEHLVDEVEALIKRLMEQETLFPIDVPLAVDIDVSRRWGEEEFAKQHEVIET